MKKLVKNKHFINGLERVLKERGPMRLRDAMFYVTNRHGIRMKIQPSVNQVGALLAKDKRFVKVKITRECVIWGARDETEV